MPREESRRHPGIDPGTFRLVAQCLNHYATPYIYIYIYTHTHTQYPFQLSHSRLCCMYSIHARCHIPGCMIHAVFMPGFLSECMIMQHPCQVLTCQTVWYMQDPCQVTHVKLYDSLAGFAVKVMQHKLRCPSRARASFKTLGAERIVAELWAVKKILG